MKHWIWLLAVVALVSCEQARRDRKETEGSEAVSAAASAAVTDTRSADERLCDMIGQAVEAGLVVPGVGDFRQLQGVEWKAPIAEPKQTLKEVVSASEAAVQAEFDRRVPPSERKAKAAQIREEAEAHFAMYPRGAKVTLKRRKGRGTQTEVTGPLSDIGPDRVRVGSHFIRREDIDEDEQARLFKDVHDRRVQQRVQQKTGAWMQELHYVRQDAADAVLPDAFRKAGYAPNILVPGAKMDKAKPERWISQAELLAQLRAYTDELAAALKENGE